MNKQSVLALVAGLLGGMATHYIAPPVALAQNQPPARRDLRAQSFTLVDQSDRNLATFSAEPVRQPTIVPNPRSRNPNQTTQPVPEMRIVLRDANGREIWSAGSEPQLRPLLSEKQFSK